MSNARDKANIPVLNFASKGIDDNATSTAITIDSNENVGIGGVPATVNQRLFIEGNNSALIMGEIKNIGGPVGLQLTANNGTDAKITFGDLADNGRGRIIYSNSDESMRFDVNNLSEKMRLNGTGLGIGTSSPSSPLTVSSSTTNAPLKLITTGSQTYSGIIFESTQSDDYVGIGVDVENLKLRTDDGHITFCVAENTEKMRLSSAGNLGIGTSSPGQTLDVVGNAEINGNIYNNGKLNIRKDGASESEHLVITNESPGSNASPTFTDLHFNGYSGKDRGRIRVQDQSNNKTGGFMRIETTGGTDSTDGSGFETRIFLDNDGDIFFYEDTGTTAKVKWDAINERFGIGTTAPTLPLEVSGSGLFGGSVIATGSTTTTASRRAIMTHDGTSMKLMASGDSTHRNMIFYRDGGDDETMRINSSGKLLINTTSAISGSSAYLHLKNNYTNTGMSLESNNTAPHHSITFHNPNGQVGFINTSGTSTVYSTSSDYRLKENVVEMTNATDRLKQLQPKRFNFIADEDTTVDGFIAHEVSSVVPEAISGTHNEVEVWRDGEELPDGVSIGDNKLDDNGNTIPKYQGIDQSKLVPLLVKTIQELEARITALETNQP
jgi:hypothetical protein